MLWLLNGHCNSPIAAFAQMGDDGDLRLRAQVMSLDGTQLIEADAIGDPERPRELGRAVAMDLLRQGAQALIAASAL